jgi:hypothetical protein
MRINYHWRAIAVAVHGRRARSACGPSPG